MAKVKATQANRRPAAEVRFIEPMYALAVKNLPDGQDWLYEIKFDGYRCLAGKRNDGVTLWSRRGNLFTAQFPDIARACERLPADTLLDGKILAVDESGRISFNLLQHHRSQAQALLFYAFDVLIYRGKSLVNIPLEERRKVLSEIFDKVRSKASPINLRKHRCHADRVGVCRQTVRLRGNPREAEDLVLRIRQTQRCVAQVSHQPRPGVSHRRVRFREPHRFYHCRVLSRRHTAVCGQGAKRLCSAQLYVDKPGKEMDIACNLNFDCPSCRRDKPTSNCRCPRRL